MSGAGRRRPWGRGAGGVRPCGLRVGSVRADGVDADADRAVAVLPADADPGLAVRGGEAADEDSAVALGFGASADDVLARRAGEGAPLEVRDVRVGERDDLVAVDDSGLSGLG